MLVCAHECAFSRCIYMSLHVCSCLCGRQNQCQLAGQWASRIHLALSPAPGLPVSVSMSVSWGQTQVPRPAERALSQRSQLPSPPFCQASVLSWQKTEVQFCHIYGLFPKKVKWHITQPPRIRTQPLNRWKVTMMAWSPVSTVPI